jgi:excisionase family DNA binding protein
VTNSHDMIITPNVTRTADAAPDAVARDAPQGRATRTPALPRTGDWLTPIEASSYLGLPSVRALYQAVRRGTVPGHKLGRALRFLRAELDRTLLNNPTRLSATVTR